MSAVTTVDLRAAMGHFATGVTVVGAGTQATTVNAVASVSLDPPLVLVCLRDESLTLGEVLATERFVVSVLHREQEHLAQRFARRGSMLGPDDLAGALVRLECAVHEVADGGDHRIVVGRVLVVEHGAGAPLLYYRGAYGALEAP